MGFYDNRCSLTGVSTWLNEAVLVLVETTGTTFRPVTLGVAGSCNRFGSIDGFKADPNVNAIGAYFRAKLTAKELCIGDPYYLPKGVSVAKDVEQFFQAFERNSSDGASNGLIDRPLTPALVPLTIWGEILKRSKARGTPEEQFERIFGDGDIPRAIYSESLSKVANELAEQAAITDFMIRHEIAWKPSEIYGQGDPEEVRRFLREAQSKFSNSPDMLEILAGYGECMEDEMAEMN